MRFNINFIYKDKWDSVWDGERIWKSPDVCGALAAIKHFHETHAGEHIILTIWEAEDNASCQCNDTCA